MKNEQQAKSFLSGIWETWGPASLSYMALGIAQILLAASIKGPLSILMLILAAMGLLSALGHKGVTFIEVRMKHGAYKSLLPPRTTQMATGALMAFLCAQIAFTEMAKAAEPILAAAIFGAISGWLASMDQSKNNEEQVKKQ